MVEGIEFGLTAVALACVCVSAGFVLTGLSRGVKIQASILNCLVELTNHLQATRTVEGATVHQMMHATSWRELPQDGQLMMRQSLVKLLAEMDRELPPRN